MQVTVKHNSLDENRPALNFLTYSDYPAGRGRPALIFLHGTASHAHYWDHLAGDFEEDYAVYSLDFRGHGDSEHTGKYNQIEYFVSDLRSLIARINPPEMMIVGHSLGGFAGLVYAAEDDPRLTGLVMCDVKTFLSEDERASLKRSASKPQPRFATLDDLVARFISTLADSTASQPLLVEIAKAGARQNKDDGTFSFKYDRLSLDFPAPQPLKYAPGVGLPVLVINGEQSKMVTGDEAYGVAAALPRGRHLAIAGAGHHVFLDQPRLFSQAVREFLKDNEGYLGI